MNNFKLNMLTFLLTICCIWQMSAQEEQGEVENNCETFFSEVEIDDCKNSIQIIDITNGTEPYQISWSTGDTGTTIENLSGGTYSLSITDANDCTFEEDYTINSSPFQAIATIITHPTSEDSNIGFIDLYITGGTPPYTHNYAWRNEFGDIFLLEDLNDLLPGIYFIYASDENGCEEQIIITLDAICFSSTVINTNFDDNTNTYRPLNPVYQLRNSISTLSTTSNLPDVVINKGEVVDLKSAKIKLNAGFKVENGGCLNATIEPCR